MDHKRFYIGADTPSLRQAARFLAERGVEVTGSPGADITHLLLPVPSFDSDEIIKGGVLLRDVLDTLPERITVFGGNLQAPLLARYKTGDFLQDEQYLAENAAITADCALRVMLSALPTTLRGLQILILGWGRIGKCLAALLQAVGCQVTIAARKETDRAMAAALGYTSVSIDGLASQLVRYRVIFNTVPYLILRDAQMIHCRSDCMKIDLASSPGLGGSDVICARGLPGKMAPEASGRLIAQTALRLCNQKEAKR